MVSTFTPNLGIEEQGTGDNPGSWGTVLNTAALTIIDNAMGGVQTLSLSNAPVAISTTQSQNNAFLLTGTLTGNVVITFPAIGRTYFVANNTTGNFSVTLARSGGGTTAVIRQGRNGFFVLTSAGVTAQTIDDVPTGAIFCFGANAAPSGYLECDGSAVSRTTYAALFGVIGTTFGAGNGTTTFNIPDMRGYFARGWDHGRGIDTGRVFGSNQTGMVGPHNHTFTGTPLATHLHSYVAGDNGSDLGPHWGGGGYKGSQVTLQTQGTSAGTPAGTIANNSGTETRPVNVALLYMVKT